MSASPTLVGIDTVSATQYHRLALMRMRQRWANGYYIDADQRMRVEEALQDLRGLRTSAEWDAVKALAIMEKIPLNDDCVARVCCAV